MARLAAISPSRAKEFVQCPLKFRFRSIDRLPEPPSSEALRGTLVHSVLEHLFDAPAIERTESHAQSLLVPRWQALLKDTPEHAKLFENKQALDEWLASARPLISNYFTMETPSSLEPAARETFVEARLPSGLAIRGIIDRLDQTPGGALRVVDYKTGKSPSPRFQEDAIFQMRFYATALYLSQNNLPMRTQLVYLKDGRTLTYDPVPNDVISISAEVDSLWGQIKHRMATGQFEAKKSALCRWCHFQPICPVFGGEAPAMDEKGAEYLLTAEQAT